MPHCRQITETGLPIFFLGPLRILLLSSIHLFFILGLLVRPPPPIKGANTKEFKLGTNGLRLLLKCVSFFPRPFGFCADDNVFFPLGVRGDSFGHVCQRAASKMGVTHSNVSFPRHLPIAQAKKKHYELFVRRSGFPHAIINARVGGGGGTHKDCNL